MRDFQRLISEAINGQSPIWPYKDDNDVKQEFIHYLEQQGMLPLFHHSLCQMQLSRWPKELIQAATIANKAAEKIQQYRQEKMGQVLETLADKQIDLLLFKGAANAYLLYTQAHQRPHADIDLLIRPSEFQRLKTCLTAMGFGFDAIGPKKFGPFQSNAVLNEANRPPLVLDIHWKVNNRLILADSLSFDELNERAIDLTDYTHPTKAVSLSDALLLAAIHDAGALQAEKGKFIGLYDAHLLIDKIGKNALEKTSIKAIETQIGAVFFHYIIQAARVFGDEQENIMVDSIKDTHPVVANELSAKLLKHNRSVWQDHYLDFRAVNPFSSKVDFLVNKLGRKIS